MSSYGAYAQFTSITPSNIVDVRPGGSSPHTFRLEWMYPANPLFPYTKVEIYRYITDIGENGDSFDLDSAYKITTFTTNVSSTTAFTDDLSNYYRNDQLPHLINTYNKIGQVADDKQLLDEVYYSKRAIYYSILTYGQGGGFDAIPFVILTNGVAYDADGGGNIGRIQNISTKTQVKYNTLNYEGDRIWFTQLRCPDGSIPGRISRSAVDLKNNWVWITSRTPTPNYFAFRCSLPHGIEEATYKLDGASGWANGVGVCVDGNNGNAIVGTYASPIYGGGLHVCDKSVGIGNFNAQHVYPVGYGSDSDFKCYGLAVQYNQPNTYWATTQHDDGTGIYPIYKITNNGSWAATQITSNVHKPYGIATGPDGTIFSTDWNSFAMQYRLASRTAASFSSGSWTIDATSHSSGVCTDSPSLYPNNNGEYNVFMTNRGNQKTACRSFILNTGFTGAATTWNVSFEPMGVGADSENNIWVVSSGAITKIFRMINNTDFPFGGLCRYPSLDVNEWPYSLTNDQSIEWFLTRDQTTLPALTATYYTSLTTPVNTTTAGINTSYTKKTGTTVAGATLAIQQANVTAFVNMLCANNVSPASLSGRKLYPNYAGFNTTKQWTDKHDSVFGKSYEYSDFTGSILLQTLNEQPINKDYTHPNTILPTIQLLIEDPSQSAPLADRMSWSDKQTDGYIGLTGYDDLSENLHLTANPGSFILTGWNIHNGDYTVDFNGTANVVTKSSNTNLSYDPTGNYTTGVVFNYTYHDTSKVGTIYQNIRNDFRKTNGTFVAIGSAATNVDPYTFESYNLLSNTVSTTVLERWPTAAFYIEAHEVSAKRFEWFNCPLTWKPVNRFIKNYGYLNSGLSTDNNTAWGTDPLSATFWDNTVARTYPISSWVFNISAAKTHSKAIAGSWSPVTDTLWHYTTTINYAPNDPTRLPADRINSRNYGSKSDFTFLDNLYRYGYYGFTMVVQASTSETKSADVLGQIQTQTQYLSVKEFEPFANFWAVSAQTVSSNYIDETPTVPVWSQLVDTQPPVHLPTTQNNFVSGYAPNLTVWFMDSSEAHTLPISSYNWNFGDYYDEANNTASVLTTSVSGEFDLGCWKMDKTNHLISHTYVMPGTYNVTLCVEASTTSTSDCCAKFLEADNSFYVYVEEIPPHCGCTVIDPITGYSPTTIIFNPSSIIPGSFPICRIDWNWGDNTAIETVTRVPFISTSNLGTILTSTSAFSLDTHDPRNFLISHIYTNDTINPQTFNVGLSVYACNTNTIAVCSGIDVGPILPVYEEVLEPMHLIKSRFINMVDDVAYVLEGQNLNTAFTVVLSGS
jgi:hypothetical protein